MKGQGADGVGDGVFAIDESRLVAEDDVGVARVDVLDDADEAGNSGTQHFHQVLHVRNLVAGSDETYHDFASLGADATHDVADDACSCIFVIGRDLKVLHPLADDGGDCIVFLFLDMTFGDVDDLVRSLGKAADC